jgi:hypothetical protein
MPRESRLETHFRQRMVAVGAIVYKLPPAGRNGKPDRIVFAPRGQCVMVELKKLGEVPDEHQAREHIRLRRRGHHVRVIDSNEGVESLATAIVHGFFIEGE